MRGEKQGVEEREKEKKREIETRDKRQEAQK